MAKKRDVVAEIVERKSRRLEGSHRFRIAVDHLRILERTVEELVSKDLSLEASWEIYRYFPVAIAATIESYFRSALANMIDAGDPFRTNVTKAKDIKLTLETLLAMQRDTVSIGEFVAHTLSLNNADDLGGAFSFVADTDLWHAIGIASTTAWPQQRLFEESPIEVQSRLYQVIADLYSIRHIIAHEPRPSTSVEPREAAGLCETTIEFLILVEHLVEQGIASATIRA